MKFSIPLPREITLPPPLPVDLLVNKDKYC